VISVKVNPGANLWVSFEEVELIQRKFPGRFDVHPSGGIRKLEEVERYLELGCNVIHSASSLDITEEFIAKKMNEYGVTIDD
jgi:deoxyribose-phosphate aldolase